ncbi:hypothetical protein H0A61_02167 [Koleobacter methoxysyntrophicus]|uniref:N-acetylmuramoyl-L-alanine amidase n=1 Tax=Koleobacter methoxysyntrophicus TaxID=2751313 RepID=A0A8A0RRH2_9FIRM|nr:N-acetylmuramoyl-L-alanine amidase [Koleobacter methoxysyntrophicus]QSQ09786.1 hypothetical protein H0A61_02167 [Koleobacter methoxysyntrophicus]
MIQWKGITFHHTGYEKPISRQEIDELHLKNGWGRKWNGRLYAGGYHFLIHENGIFETMRPLDIPGSHANKYNYTHIAIALNGNFEKYQPTQEQYITSAFLASWLMKKYTFCVNNLTTHRNQFYINDNGIPKNQTVCPGKYFELNKITKIIEKEEETADVYFNGVKLQNKAIVRDGTSYIPIRELCEKLGVEVIWDGKINLRR